MATEMFLHIATDEKFINRGMRLFEKVFPNCNSLRIVTSDPKKALVHVDANIKSLQFYNKNDFKLDQFFDDVTGVDYVVLHNIDAFKSELVLNSPENRKYKFLWSFWGGEIYNNVYLDSNRFISKKTHLFQDRLSVYKIFLRNLKLHFFKFKHPHYSIIKAVRKIDCVLGLKSDYDYLLTQHIISRSIPYIHFSYYPIEYITQQFNKDFRISSGNIKILLGNSATPANNHIDIFCKLAEIDLDYKLIVPLNYGSDIYSKKIESEGRKRLGDRFIPITEFMELSDYNDLLSQCEIAIMNHYRQQGVGNIVTLLWLGAKLFINRRSLLYDFFMDKKILIYDVEELSIESLHPLSIEEKEYNRNIIMSQFSETKLIRDLMNIKDV